MRHRKKTFKLGRTAEHRKALMRNLIDSLITNGKIETTLAKAKELKRYADNFLSKMKKNDLHAKKTAIKIIRTKSAFLKLFSDDFIKFINSRNGGYTRIIKTADRPGDLAPLAIIELTGIYQEKKAEKPVKETKKLIDKPEKKTEKTKEATKKQIEPASEIEIEKVAETTTEEVNTETQTNAEELELKKEEAVAKSGKEEKPEKAPVSVEEKEEVAEPEIKKESEPVKEEEPVVQTEEIPEPEKEKKEGTEEEKTEDKKENE